MHKNFQENKHNNGSKWLEQTASKHFAENGNKSNQTIKQTINKLIQVNN